MSLAYMLNTNNRRLRKINMFMSKEGGIKKVFLVTPLLQRCNLFV